MASGSRSETAGRRQAVTADPGRVTPEDEGTADIDAPADARPDRARRPLTERPLVRAGVTAWCVAGLAVVVFGIVLVLQRLTVVTVPLIVALFPAAVLVPPTSALKRRGVPPALAALAVLVLSIALLVGLFSVLTPVVAAELGGLAEKLEEGYTTVRRYLLTGPLHIEAAPLEQLLERFREQATTENADLGSRVLEAGAILVEGVAGVALLLFALFFYLKDGSRIAAWVRDLFPARLREDVQGIGDRVWFTIGAYIRGLLIIGLVDAVLIGIGLVALRVPLALPLSVLVFFGALFPIVGAFLAGTVAVLVALATNGVGAALAVLVLIVTVQQLEGHILTPVLLGRATELHPLAVIAVLTAGAVLLGVLGAFLSVPVAASVARAVAYIRARAAPA